MLRLTDLALYHKYMHEQQAHGVSTLKAPSFAQCPTWLVQFAWEASVFGNKEAVAAWRNKWEDLYESHREYLAMFN
jgi:hypothetical protein